MFESYSYELCTLYLLWGLHFLIGQCFRCVVDPSRRKVGEDISSPLQNSFIHTGHGDPYGKSWGSPAFIDEVYLRNPMDPPDVLGMMTNPGPTPKLPDRKKSKSECIKCKQVYRSPIITAFVFPINLCFETNPTCIYNILDSCGKSCKSVQSSSLQFILQDISSMVKRPVAIQSSFHTLSLTVLTVVRKVSLVLKLSHLAALQIRALGMQC